MSPRPEPGNSGWLIDLGRRQWQAQAGVPRPGRDGWPTNAIMVVINLMLIIIINSTAPLSTILLLLPLITHSPQHPSS
jgi:hypothetical protein